MLVAKVVVIGGDDIEIVDQLIYVAQGYLGNVLGGVFLVFQFLLFGDEQRDGKSYQ